MNAKMTHGSDDKAKVVKVSTKAQKTQWRAEISSHAPKQSASHSTEIAPATYKDLKKVVLAMLWVSHPKPLSQAAIEEVCGGAVKRSEVVDQLGFRLYQTEKTVSNTNRVFFGLSDKAVAILSRIQG